MIQAIAKPISLDAFLQLPETKPASEYIDGQIIQKPMPQGKHSRLQKRLIYKIESVVLPRQAAEAFPELRCSFAGRSVVPDIAVLKAEHIPWDESGEIANAILRPPDWTIEILSPNQSYKNVAKNILHCLDHGCDLGWLIDPEEKAVLALPQDGRPRSFEQPDALLPAPDWAAGLALTVGELFGWLYDSRKP